MGGVYSEAERGVGAATPAGAGCSAAGDERRDKLVPVVAVYKAVVVEVSITAVTPIEGAPE